MSCLVTIIDPNDGGGLDMMGVQYAPRVWTGSEEENPNEAPNYTRAMKKLHTLFCEEADVECVSTMLSKWHAGDSVYVYKLTSILSCLPGEVKTKKITADGILPS